MQDARGFELSDDDYIEIIVKTNLLEGELAASTTSTPQQQLSGSSVNHQSQQLASSSSILSTTVITNANESLDNSQQRKETQAETKKSEKSVASHDVRELKESFRVKENQYK